MMEDSQLYCVEYPATIKDDDKMLETLGGYQHINEAFSQPNRKLELRFRPNTPGCKATCAERSKTSSLLLKVLSNMPIFPVFFLNFPLLFFSGGSPVSIKWLSTVLYGNISFSFII